MGRQLRPVAPLTLLALLASASLALADYPWKGKVFVAHVRGQLVTLTVTKGGRYAKVSIEREPHFCTNVGGFAPVQSHTHAAGVASNGAFSETLSFTEIAPPFKLDGRVTVTGTFSKRHFKGTLKTVYASGTFCNGKTSFVAEPAPVP